MKAEKFTGLLIEKIKNIIVIDYLSTNLHKEKSIPWSLPQPGFALSPMLGASLPISNNTK
jgi:hypothetical protein